MVGRPRRRAAGILGRPTQPRRCFGASIVAAGGRRGICRQPACCRCRLMLPLEALRFEPHPVSFQRSPIQIASISARVPRAHSVRLIVPGAAASSSPHSRRGAGDQDRAHRQPASSPGGAMRIEKTAGERILIRSRASADSADSKIIACVLFIIIEKQIDRQLSAVIERLWRSRDVDSREHRQD